MWLVPEGWVPCGIIILVANAAYRSTKAMLVPPGFTA